MKERPRVIAGSQDEVNLFFETVRLLAIEAELIPTLVKPSISFRHREVAVGGFVVERDGLLQATDRVVRCRPAERTAHAAATICFRNVRVAVRADGRIDVEM